MLPKNHLRTFVEAVATLIFLGTHMATSTPEPHRLFQVSTIAALMKGIYDGDASFRTLQQQGDFGLGTVDKLDGEMIALEGTFYQITADGSVHIIPGSVKTPFAIVTTFQPQQYLSLQNVPSLVALQQCLNAALPSLNACYAIRIDGTFQSLKMRSVERQRKPYRPLTEVAKTQAVFHAASIRGTLVAFRCPAFLAGINVPGYHFHFISEDRRRGGHVLDGYIIKGRVSIDCLNEITIQLPKRGPFLTTDFTDHDAAGLQQVEGGQGTSER